jgi:protein O-GlcNAc transferase
MTHEQAIERALAHHRAGELREAETLYRQVLAENPNHADALHLLGLVGHAAGQHDAALELISRAIAIAPKTAVYHVSLAQVHASRRAYELAEKSLRRVIELGAGDFNITENLGLCLHAQGRMEEALKCFREVADAMPESGAAVARVGGMLLLLNRADEAVNMLKRAVALEPNSAGTSSNLGAALGLAGKLEEAAEALRKAVQLEPRFAEGHHNLANALRELGVVEEALAHFRQAIAIKPDYPAANSGLLLTLQYRDEDPAVIAQEHQQWERRVTGGEAIAARHDNDRTPGRRLRVGYVSPDFRRHAVTHFFDPLLAAHDPAAVEVFCYSNALAGDDVTARLKGMAHHWRDVARMNDEQLCAAVRADRIDILVDLALHSGSNRLAAFARKPAPVQVSYLGYCSSPGLSAIDWRFSDEILDGGGGAWGPEKAWRLDGGFCCYSPLDEMPEVREPPAVRNGFVTFASFGALAKVTEKMLEVWARILSSVGKDRLLIQAKGADQSGVRERYARFFEARGVSRDRIEMRGSESMAQYVQRVRDVDVCLDSYPFAGHTTTCHSLYLGVPVVSLFGDLPLSRVGLSLLSRLELRDLAVSSLREYEAKAVELAGNVDRLVELRRTLREQFASSPLMNGRRLARQVELGYQRMWWGYCNKS